MRRLGAVVLAFVAGVASTPAAQAPLPAPGFHHLHLNSTNPDATIDFYTQQFPTTSKGTFAGAPALRSPNNVWVLFNKVASPPATQPQTALWRGPPGTAVSSGERTRPGRRSSTPGCIARHR